MTRQTNSRSRYSSSQSIETMKDWKDSRTKTVADARRRGEKSPRLTNLEEKKKKNDRLLFHRIGEIDFSRSTCCRFVVHTGQCMGILKSALGNIRSEARVSPVGSGFWEIEWRRFKTMMDEESFREAVGSLRGGLLITTKGAAVRHRVYKRRDWKERTISYFNQIISRTMGPTGEKSSFASCFDTGRSLPPPWNAMHGKSIVRTFVATLNRFYAIVQIYELWGKT